MSCVQPTAGPSKKSKPTSGPGGKAKKTSDSKETVESELSVSLCALIYLPNVLLSEISS